MRLSCVLPALLAISVGCGENPEAAPLPGGQTTGEHPATSATTGEVTTVGTTTTSTTTTGDPSPTSAPNVNPLGRTRCTTPAGVSGSPGTIEDAVVLLNALPKPTSVACFLESLERPLAASATSSRLSAQPAHSALSPRVFIKIGELWVSIVVDGDSSHLIEFGYQLGDGFSIKAELKGPFLEQVTASAPYDRVLLEDSSVCAGCHFGEAQVESVTFATAFKSIALRPTLDSYVSLSALANEASSCDWSAEPERCEMLSALFDGGPVVEASFPSSMPTFL